MSIVHKKNKSLLLISLVTISCYSQTEDKKKEVNVFFNLKDKALNRIYVNKDSTEAHFSIYVENTKLKKARDKAN
jgi:hypothetical protein